jgi:hypothetical protein
MSNTENVYSKNSNNTWNSTEGELRLMKSEKDKSFLIH